MSDVNTASPRCAADAMRIASLAVAPGTAARASPAIFASRSLTGSTSTRSRISRERLPSTRRQLCQLHVRRGLVRAGVTRSKSP
jgi:hypothetical protein